MVGGMHGNFEKVKKIWRGHKALIFLAEVGDLRLYDTVQVIVFGCGSHQYKGGWDPYNISMCILVILCTRYIYENLQ